MADGIRSAVITFKEVLRVIQARQPMPHMRQLVASFDFGHVTKDPEICQRTFPCETPPTDISVRPNGKVL